MEIVAQPGADEGPAARVRVSAKALLGDALVYCPAPEWTGFVHRVIATVAEFMMGTKRECRPGIETIASLMRAHPDTVRKSGLNVVCREPDEPHEPRHVFIRERRWSGKGRGRKFTVYTLDPDFEAMVLAARTERSPFRRADLPGVVTPSRSDGPTGRSASTYRALGSDLPGVATPLEAVVPTEETDSSSGGKERQAEDGPLTGTTNDGPKVEGLATRTPDRPKDLDPVTIETAERFIAVFNDLFGRTVSVTPGIRSDVETALKTGYRHEHFLMAPFSAYEVEWVRMKADLVPSMLLKCGGGTDPKTGGARKNWMRDLTEAVDRIRLQPREEEIAKKHGILATLFEHGAKLYGDDGGRDD